MNIKKKDEKHIDNTNDRPMTNEEIKSNIIDDVKRICNKEQPLPTLEELQKSEKKLINEQPIITTDKNETLTDVHKNNNKETVKKENGNSKN